MKGFQKRLIGTFFSWGLLIAMGHILTISDSRLYQVGTFFLAVTIFFFGDRLWRKWQEKKLGKE